MCVSSAAASAGAQCQGLHDIENGACVYMPPYALRSGPRKTIYHDPSQVNAALVTCGGLCPGLNDVVQNIVYTLVSGPFALQVPAPGNS